MRKSYIFYSKPVLLTFLLWLCMFVVVHAEAVTGSVSVNGEVYPDGVTYTYTESDDGITISAAALSNEVVARNDELCDENNLDNQEKGYVDLEFPKEINGKQVVSLSSYEEGINIIRTEDSPDDLCDKYINSIKLPEGLLTLDGYTFSSITTLKSVTLPSTLQSLGVECFLSCEQIEELTIPASVTSIGEYCFMECSSLEKVQFDDIANSQLSSLGVDCFSGTISLEDVILPMSNLSIVNSVFSGSGIKHIIFYGKPSDQLNTWSFLCLINSQGSSSNGELYPVLIPVEYINQYKEHGLFSVKTEESSLSVSAYRITSARYSTVCLPYSISKDKSLGIKTFYREKTSVEDSGLGLSKDNTEIDFAETSELNAGVPYVFEQTNASGDGEDFAPQTQFGIKGFVAFALTDATETAAARPANGTYLKGTFSDMKYDDLGGNERCFLLQSGIFKKWVDNNAWIDAYRAYLDLSSANASSSSKAITLHFDDSEATGIAEVKTETVKNGAMFDLQGRRISHPVSGQLYIRNGQKYLAR